uniref:Uncharacterized protein n=1 Tax=mine drainage metagenome TaxID=410659 RepID=E6QN51_9ZZZZ
MEDENFGVGGKGVGSVMGDEDGLDFAFEELGQELSEYLVARDGVEGGEWLVEQKQAWAGGNGAGKGDALRFAAREGLRLAGKQMFGPDEGERIVDDSLLRVGVDSGKAVGDILSDGEVRKERWLLGGEGDLALAGREVSISGCFGKQSFVKAE